ncbi:MAG: hypothetical protein WAO83_14800 [Fuerstiella sp.]
MTEESPIEAACENCNHTATYDSSLKGTVQVCDKCGDFVDVGEVEWDESDYAEIDEAEAAGDGDIDLDLDESEARDEDAQN